MALLGAMEEAVAEIEAANSNHAGQLLGQRQEDGTEARLPATSALVSGSLAGSFAEEDDSEDEEDGEIEYGHGFPATPPSGQAQCSPDNQQSSSADPPLDWGEPMPPPPPSTSITASSSSTLNDDPSFGISYKPMHKPAKQASNTNLTSRLPHGSLYQDEHEFERDLLLAATTKPPSSTSIASASVLTRSQDNDDDFEDDDDDFALMPTTTVADVMAKARQAYAQPSSSSSSSFHAVTRGDLPIQGEGLGLTEEKADSPPQQVIGGGGGGGGGNEGLRIDNEGIDAPTNSIHEEGINASSSSSVWTEAQAALDEIADTYARGFGDTEVRALETSSSSSSSATTVPPPVPTAQLLDLTRKGAAGGGSGLASTIIVEEDEEGLLKAEAEAEKAAAQAALEAQRQQGALWQAWNLPPPSQSREGRKKKAVVVDKEEEGKGEKEIDYDEAVEALGAKYVGQKPKIEADEKRAIKNKTLLGGLLHHKPPKLNPMLEAERDIILCLAEESYDPTNAIHLQSLRKVWYGLTDSRNCPISGSHWEEIGFQGADPRTDLNRSMGVWSVLQALKLLETQPMLCKEAMLASRAPTSHWPFMLVSIGFTRLALEAIRDGRGNRSAILRGSVSEACHTFHQALLYDFLQRVRLQPTVHHATHLGALRAVVNGKGILALEARYTQALQSRGGIRASLRRTKQQPRPIIQSTTMEGSSSTTSSSSSSSMITSIFSLGSEAKQRAANQDFTDLTSVVDESLLTEEEFASAAAATTSSTAKRVDLPKAAKAYLKEG